MTSAGANSIVDNVSKSFVKTASGSILSVFNELGVTLQNELPTIQKMKNMVFFLEGQLPELEQSSNTVQRHATHAEDIILKVHDGLKAVEDITSQKDQLVSDVSIYVDSAHQAFNAINPLLEEDLSFVKSDNESLIGIADRLKNQELSNDEVNQLTEQGRSRIEKDIYLLDSMHNLLVRVNQFNEQNVESINELRENSQKVYSPYQIYIGRYLIFLIIGCMQALIVSIGNILLLKVYVAEKWENICFRS